MEIYDDRVEIINPGGLPKGLSKKAFGHISIRRNEIIADLFFRMDKVERVGMGIKKMKEAMNAAGLREPIFEPDSFFRAVFFRSPDFALKDTKPSSVKKFGEKFGEGSVKSSVKLLAFLAENTTATAGEAAAVLGISKRAVEKNLAALKAKGLLKRIGPDKGGHWEVVK